MNFLSTKGSHIKLDTTQFDGGSGLLDVTTDDVQKALTAINLALDYASTSYAGVMSSEDKIKLDGIETGAQVNNVLTTLQGNTFNSASQLVKLGTDGKLPVLDGSNLINVSSGGIGNVFIQESQPTPSTGVSNFWIKPENGSFGLYIVTGD